MPKTVMPAERWAGAVTPSRVPIRPRGSVKAASGRRSAPDAPRARLVEIQRARMLGAALKVVDELGYPGATVAHVTSRARVSRLTFYNVFDNREDCLLAALESVVDRIERELSELHLDALPWRERVRGGLWTILSFFDREPVLARVCVVQALRGGPSVLERRERVLAGLVRIVEEGRGESQKAQACPPLMADGLVGAAFGIVYGRLLRGAREPLTDLFGELMGMIVLPYLGPAAASREQTLAAPAATRGVADAGFGSAAEQGERGRDPLVELPMRLTYRTARVLEVLATCPESSNRVVGARSGVSDQGQISRLLARLERLGLASNAGDGHLKGEANAWRLTAKGAQVERSIRVNTSNGRESVEGS
jgi:AcrR family transcriptional regulator